MTQWFNVDKTGLAKLMEGRSKAFILHELVQNSWDEASKLVQVTITPISGTRTVEIVVEDDNPDGFANLEHAYTLFAESGKKADASKRGRFNMGEKLVLALAEVAEIATTKGLVTFDKKGRMVRPIQRKSGSRVTVIIKMTRDEMHEMISASRKLIVPDGIKTTINGELLPVKDMVATTLTTLPTVIGDEEGVLRKTQRSTVVRMFEPAPGETAMIYEMGIPVVETGDRFHCDVQQKVPLNMDRDNVTPAFLRALRVAVLNSTYKLIEPEETTETWVRDACGDDNISSEAVTSVIHARFGETAVTYDPSDPEANKLSTLDGRQIVHGGSLSAGEWNSVRKAGVLPPAGQVTPSPKPFSPDGKPLMLIPRKDWTPGMVRIAQFAGTAGARLLADQITVEIVNEPTWGFNATYGGNQLIFNLGRLGHKFFDEGISQDVLRLVIHELAHDFASDHLSREYYDGLTILGARMTGLALNDPGLFK